MKAFLVAFFTILGTFFVTIALCYASPPEWVAFSGALPSFIVALVQGTFVLRRFVRERASITGIVTLGALFPVAALAIWPLGHDRGEDSGTSEMIILYGALLLAFATFFASMAGAILWQHMRPLRWLAIGVTAFAFLVALLPSLPAAWQIWYGRPNAAAVSSRPIVGVLRLGGPPVTVHGNAYSLEKSGFDGALCDVQIRPVLDPTATITTSSVDCAPLPLHCDDHLRWCLVTTGRDASGKDYDGHYITIRGPPETSPYRGELGLRFAAAVLVLLAALLVYRARGAKDPDAPHVLSASALTSAAMGIALVVRVMLSRM